MALSWGPDPDTEPRRPEHAATQRLMEALDPRCRRMDLYESRNVARGAIRRLRREKGLWPYVVWRAWPCDRIGCDWWHAGPRGGRAR